MIGPNLTGATKGVVYIGQVVGLEGTVDAVGGVGGERNHPAAVEGQECGLDDQIGGVADGIEGNRARITETPGETK